MILMSEQLGHALHVDGVDLLEGGKSLTVVRAVSCAGGPPQEEIQQGRIQ